MEEYLLGTELTKAGLGFPQYSNDDVVIEGLIKKGYDPKDAANYAVAACWEFIIPGVGFDVANIGAMSYPKAVDRVLHSGFTSCGSFDEVMDAVKNEINAECEAIMANIKDLCFKLRKFSVLPEHVKDVLRC